MQNIFFHLPLPAQFAWKEGEEDMVSNKANPLEKQVKTSALEINSSSQNPLIDFTSRLGFFLSRQLWFDIRQGTYSHQNGSRGKRKNPCLLDGHIGTWTSQINTTTEKRTMILQHHGEGERFLTNSTGQLFWTSNPLRHPELSISQQHFPSQDISFFPNLPASKHLAYMQKRRLFKTAKKAQKSSNVKVMLCRLVLTSQIKTVIEKQAMILQHENDNFQ